MESSVLTRLRLNSQMRRSAIVSLYDAMTASPFDCVSNNASIIYVVVLD